VKKIKSQIRNPKSKIVMTPNPQHTREQFLERPLPSSPDSERVILGAILLDNELITQAIEQISPEDFYSPNNRRIFKAMTALFEKGERIDPILIGEELKKDGSIDSIGGVATITNLTYGLPHFSDIFDYTKVVKDKAMTRNLIKVCNQITSEALAEEEDAEMILDHAEQMIFALADEKTRQGFSHVQPIAESVLAKVQEFAKRESHALTGLSTGFRDLDEKTSGLQPSDLIIVAARPSMGKTALCLTLAQNAAIIENAVVAVFSLEMSKEQLVMRMLSSEARVDAHRFRTGYLTRDEWGRLAEAIGTLSNARIFIDDTAGISVLEMRAKTRRLYTEQRRPAQMQTFDNFQRMFNRQKAVRQFRPAVFVIWSNGRHVFGQSQFKTNERIKMTVRDVMNGLPHRPASGTIRRVEMLVRQIFNCRFYFLRKFSNFTEQFLLYLCRKFKISAKFSNWIT
jgi:replicative DNA helicase